MPDCCSDILATLEKTHKNGGKKFDKEDLGNLIGFILTWPQRQCKCIFQENSYLIELREAVKILIDVALEYLKKRVKNSKNKQGRKNERATPDKDTGTGDDHWTEDEAMKIFGSIAKVLQINFPLYKVHKIYNTTPTRVDKKLTSKYCDINEGEISDILLYHIVYFCESHGLTLIHSWFRDADPSNFPLPLAHSLISIVQQLRVWFHVKAIVHNIMPLRGSVIRYLCKLTDKELRLSDRRLMADTMWTTVKSPPSYSLIFDRDSMDLAFRYFTSSTLTVRLTGLNQITNQVHAFIEIFHNDTQVSVDVDEMCADLASWLVEINIIDHLFGPNLHVELLKQSQVILNFLAQEAKITNQHLQCIWAAAQLKHASRYVHDLLTTLAKHLDTQLIQYLLDLVSSLPVASHNKQTLCLTLVLTRIVWNNALSSHRHHHQGTIARRNSPTSSPAVVGTNTAAAVAASLRSNLIQRNNSSIGSSSSGGTISDASLDTGMPGRSDSQEEIPEAVKREYTGSTVVYSQDQTIKEGSGSSSSGESMTCSDRAVLEDFDDEELAYKHHEDVTCMADESKKINFRLEDVCVEGNTLLWDIVQDKNACQLEDGLLQEAEKLLCQLICYAGEKKLRLQFVKGCLDNLAQNKSVVLSLGLLPKLFCSFQQFNGRSTYNVVEWANKKLMMEFYFDNLVQYCQDRQKTGGTTDTFLNHYDEVQSRLHFLTSVYSSELSPPTFKLTSHQVDLLWSCLVEDDECSDDTLDWFVNQARNKDLHALDVSTFKYIFKDKMSALKPQTVTMTGLSLFQQLFSLFLNEERGGNSKIPGMDQLWSIALNAQSGEVSQAAITFLNSFYINDEKGSLRREREFIQQCMDSLKNAAVTFSENLAVSLQVTERALTLLKDHLMLFKERFAYHLRLRALEGQGIHPHKCKIHNNEKNYHIRVVCQPAGRTEKGTFRMHSTDLVAELRAEITFWCTKLQEKHDQMKQDTNNIGATVFSSPGSSFLPFSSLTPPFRLISHGHELTPELDEKSLGEVGFKDLQIVFVSVGAGRRDCGNDSNLCASSLLPTPNESIPLFIMQEEPNFTQLFDLIQLLRTFFSKERKTTDNVQLTSFSKLDSKELNTGHYEKETFDAHVIFDDSATLSKVQRLQHMVWDLLMFLPTNFSIRENLETFGHSEDSQESEQVDWSSLLDPSCPNKLLYSLEIVHSIAKRSFEEDLTKDSEKSDLSSDSDMSDIDDDSEEKTPPVPQKKTKQELEVEKSHLWSRRFVESGGLGHLLDIFLSGCLLMQDNPSWTQSHQECLASLLNLIKKFGALKLSEEGIQDDEDVFVVTLGSPGRSRMSTAYKEFRIRYKSTEQDETVDVDCLSKNTIELIDKKKCLEAVMSTLYESTVTSHRDPVKPNQIRAEVLYHAVEFLVSWTHTDNSVFNSLVHHPKLKPWLQRLVLLAPEHSVRHEASRGLFKLCLIKENSNVNMLLEALLSFLPLARNMKCIKIPGTRTIGPSCREYFNLLLKLVDTLPPKRTEKEVLQTSLDSLTFYLAESIVSHESLEKGRNSYEDETLSGMLKLCAAVVRQNSSFKDSEKNLTFMKNLFQQCLFDLPEDTSDIHAVPKCRSKASRHAAFDLLLELSWKSEKNFTELQNLLLEHHSSLSGNHVSYGWHYWPHDNCRSSCGLAGMINLGATCYMASCMQQLYMMPEARASILKVQSTGNKKLDTSLKEMQKMFCFLMESERKAYNPRSFCKTYIMDKKPLNTGEQKDMNEFFTDLITKLEDMSPDMRELVRDLFCGEISNNVVSLDCSHVSQTKEEFFSVRCTVADMKDLYESLDEVTIKDTLEGDNMYTCSQCGKKVRAEKRACFKVLPRILCFNTMRYTFNMVTMMKEKVNTHFSFPRQLKMAPYTEEYLMGEKKDDDPEKDTNYTYNLIGVVVHTGTAEGGHYYSFIRDRTSGQNDRWFLFNDAEVKPFDPQQIASECFGGEMMTKTYDAVTEKFLDFSFEKTHSAYMLFYEREEKTRNTSTPKSVDEMDPQLSSWIWKDNLQFIRDKQIFDLAYFNFMWSLCSKVAPTFTESSQTSLLNVKLATSFLLETFIHSKEKPGLKGWSDLLVVHFDNSREACQWFLDHMAEDSWWLHQIFLRCPVQATRQVFARLCLHVIQILRPSQVALYCSSQKDVENGEKKRTASCSVTNFVKSILKLLSKNVKKSYMKNMTELFSFLHQFCQLGSEERRYLLSVNTITKLGKFFFTLKFNDPVEASEDDDPDDDDDEVVPIFPEEKFRPFALEKMITVIAYLVDEAKGQSKEVQLSKSDREALLGSQGYPFIFEMVKDAVNLKHTGNLVFTLCMHNQELAEKIVTMLMSSVKRLSSEQTQPFFKLLNNLTELSLGSPGSFSFTDLILERIWKAAEYNACVCLEWLQNVVSKNKMARQFVLKHMNTWVEPFLIADNSMRIRNDSAYLLVALVPSNHFKQGFRTKTYGTPQKDVQLSQEAQTVLHEVFITLLNLMPNLKTYGDRTLHGTTKLTSYFAVLNYCLVSDKEKEMFTPYSPDIWKLFHPLMSEPNISVFPNKQALLAFWYHVCIGCEKNVSFITDTPFVSKYIPYNYILSNDDPEVIAFNRSVLPIYYGLLRLACEHSHQFTRELAKHGNMTWAFEYLTNRINQYPMAVDELFNLMNLFAGDGQNLAKNSEASAAAAAFRERTIKMYVTTLDCGSHWTTLIYALKILLKTEEDKLTVALNNGLMSLADAFTTLHLMYHEATACHVTGDLIDVLSVMLNIFNCCRSHLNKQDVKNSLYGWTERIDMAQKLLSLLNFYTPKEIRKSCLEVLHTIILIYQEDCVNSLIPIIYQSHKSRKENPDPVPVGGFFPRRHGKSSISSKTSRQISVPELNMALHKRYIDCAKGVDVNYDNELADYFLPYHQLVEKLLRCGLTQEKVNENVIKLSCLMAIEGLPLHFTLFTKMWSEIYNKSHETSKYEAYLKELCQTNEFIEYVDLILFEERTIINVNPTNSFLCSIFPRISSRVAHEQWNSLVNALVISIIADQSQADSFNDSELNDLAQRLTADLRVLQLLFTASPPQKADVSEMLLPSLKRLLGICRRHQKAKQDKLNERKEGEKTARTELDEKKEKGSGEKGSGEKGSSKGEDNNENNKHFDPPPSKRRRGEDASLSSDVGESSTAQGKGTKDAKETSECSKGKRVTESVGTKTKLSGQLTRKVHLQWIDWLAKIIESVLGKIPK